MYKRLITCSDGTWNRPAMKDSNGDILYSNVCLLYDAITPKGTDGVEQLKVYDTGVGSSYSLWDRIAGGATGAGIDGKIKDSYTFLLLNYAPGDHIYLFGFSRGAYTARSLAGFIRCCGILKPEYIHLVDKAYELYRDKNDYTNPNSDLMRSFRRNYCFNDVTRIRFIGVWDTVGALGIPLPAWQLYNRARYKFHDTTLSSTVDYAYQALAIDEHRKNFEPVLWKASENDAYGKNLELEQRWFTGAHCDVGGGYPHMGLSNGTLQWLAGKAGSTGLQFDPVKLRKHQINVLDDQGNSFTPLYWLSGWVRRKIMDPDYAGQVVDPSVYERIKAKPGYRPGNI